MNKKNKLKACPFCGEKELRIVDIGFGYFCVACDFCHGSGPSADSKEATIKAWNKRAKKK